ncbi:MAG TPA: hypothetical protein VMF59_03770 [Bacteroidota bacterium]|nr:hypothetical protein [Bacteroidota bacterium]
MRRQNSFGTMVLAAAAALAGCGTAEIASHWKSSDIEFFARGSRWPVSSFEEKRVTGTVCNDSEYIYIGLRTADPGMQRLLVRGGITWWFDSKGGSRKTFGVHYPAPPPGERSAPGEEDVPAPIAERQLPRSSPTDIELYSGEKEHQRMSILATGGIQAGFRRERDTLVYEIRIPLTAGSTHPFGIGAGTGSVIGLGAETSDYRASADLPVERPEGEGEPEGGFGGRRTGGRGRGGPRPGAGPRGEQINFWMNVRLATGDAPLRASP